MRRKLLVPFVLLLVAVLVAVWGFARRDSQRSSVANTVQVGPARSTTNRQVADRPPPSWFAASNVKPRSIAGRVLLDGRPVPNATVTLQSSLTRAGYAAPVELVSDVNGRFDFGLRPAGAYTLGAASPNTVSATKTIDLADPKLVSDAVELRLHSCDATVSGTISDANGAPIDGAAVRRDGFIVARTDPAGAYRMCAPVRELELQYEADGYGAVILTVQLVGPMVQDVVLVPAASIIGRVVRADNGDPVAGAQVFANSQQGGPERAAMRTAISEADGTFRIDGLNPALFRVWGFATGLAAEGTSSVLAEVGAMNEVTLKLEARAQISGIVLNGTEPVAGVELTAVRKSPNSRALPVFTQADGSFVLESVPVGEIVFVATNHEVISPASFTTQLATRHDNVKIQISATGAIRGIVMRNGRPVEGARVCCVNTPTTLKPALYTDADGRFAFLGVSPGTYEVGAQSDEAGAFARDKKIVIEGTETKTLDIDLDLAGEISGVVVDANGKPVPDVYVRWVEDKTHDLGQAVTDRAGRYRARAMSGGGIYRAAVYSSATEQVPYPPAPGTSYPTREVATGTSVIATVRIAIDFKRLSISGRVVDLSGTPVVDARISALAMAPDDPPWFDTWRRYPSTASDADGTFTLRDLPAGSYALQAKAIDGGDVIVPGIVAGATGVVLSVARPGSIAGKLVGFAQPPILYASLLGDDAKLNPGSVDGTTFRIAGLKPGRYLVNAQNMAEGDAQIVDVRPGERAAVTLTAKGQGAVHATVLDFRTRKPVVGAMCRAVMSAGGEQGLTNWDPNTAPRSDARGRVVIDPAPAGSLTIACEMPKERQAAAASDVTLASGARAEITILTAEWIGEAFGNVGLHFAWQVTAPRIADLDAIAEAAGLAIGDVVTAVNGGSVAGLNGTGVWYLLASQKIGSTITLTVQRGDATKTVSLEVRPPG